MIQGNTWYDYLNELKRFLCDVAKSRWARYLFYPLGVFVAIMYMTSQAGAHPYSFLSYVCDFAGCIAVVILRTMYDKETDLRIQRDNELVQAKNYKI